MASRSFRARISATRSSSVWNASANSHRHSPIRTATRTTTTGARWSRKSLNDRPPRLAMMMFGGSPTRVAVPPMFEANTSASR